MNDYFRDPVYMLELNLQRIRRELIQLLDESEENECFVCNRLKCCCVDNSSIKSSTLSVLTSVPSSKNSVNSGEEVSNPVAPPADSLPRPEWQNAGVAAWVRASTSTPNLDPNNEPTQDGNEPQNISNIAKEIASNNQNIYKPNTSQVVNEPHNISNIAKEVVSTSKNTQSKVNTHQFIQNKSTNQNVPSTSQAVLNNTNNTKEVNSPNISLEIKVTKANVSLQPQASNMNQIRILSRSTPNICQEPSKVAQKPKAPSQDGKEPEGKAWPKTIWNEWNQLDDGVRWPGAEQNPDSVEAFFRSFSEVAGNSSAVGYSYF